MLAISHSRSRDRSPSYDAVVEQLCLYLVIARVGTQVVICCIQPSSVMDAGFSWTKLLDEFHHATWMLFRNEVPSCVYAFGCNYMQMPIACRAYDFPSNKYSTVMRRTCGRLLAHEAQRMSAVHSFRCSS